LLRIETALSGKLNEPLAPDIYPLGGGLRPFKFCKHLCNNFISLDLHFLRKVGKHIQDAAPAFGTKILIFNEG
jgi:hypothetical protein